MHRLALIEDDYEIRQSLRDVFAQSTKLELELETDAVERAVLYYRHRPAPHLILLDLNLNGISGIDGLPLLRRHLPTSLIVVHTILEDEDKVFQAVYNGASGYLLKTTPHEDLEKHLLTTIEEQGSPLSPSIARRILNHFKTDQRRIQKINDAEGLTETELSVINLLVAGLSYQQVADKLGMTINGIRYYVKRIYTKLQVKTRNQLVHHVLDHPNYFN